MGKNSFIRHRDLIILDEAHRIKSAGSRISMFCSSLGRRAAMRLALSGTPLPHSPLDAYGLYRMLDPGIFGTSNAKFKERYAVMSSGEPAFVVGYKNLDELQARMNRIMMRVTKEDALDLPELMHVRIPCALGREARRIPDSRARHGCFRCNSKPAK